MTKTVEKLARELVENFQGRAVPWQAIYGAIQSAIEEERELCAKLADKKYDLWAKNSDGSQPDIPKQIERLSMLLQTSILERLLAERETAQAIRNRGDSQ